MASVPLRQTRFDVGELAPHMYGRVDDARYFRALRKCQNWLPTDHGDLLTRPGTRFLMQTKDNAEVRLMSGIFPDGVSVIFVIGPGWMRFIENGVPKTVVGAPYDNAANYVPGDVVLNSSVSYYCIAATVGHAPPNGTYWYALTPVSTPGGSSYYEIPTPWTDVALQYLKKAQAGYTTTICYGGQDPGLASLAPRDLVRSTPFVGVGGYGYTLGTTPVTVPSGVAAPPSPVTNIPIWDAAITFERGGRCFDNNGGGTFVDWICIQDAVTGAGKRPPVPNLTAGRTELDGSLYWMPTIDKEHQALQVQYVATAVVQDANGVVYESLPSAVYTVSTVATVDRGHPVLLFNPTLGTGFTALYLKLYKGNNGVWGWVGNVVDAGSGAVIVDNGLVPDFTQQPPTGVSPFAVSGGYAYPSLVTYFEDRRIFAGSKGIPQGIWGSASGNFYRWDRPDPGRDSDSYLIELASEDYEELHSLTPLRRLVTLTGRSEFAVGGTNGALTRSNQDARRHSRWGSTWLDPIVIGNGVLFVSARNNLVRNFYPVFTMYGEIWDGEELSGTAHHLVELQYFADGAILNGASLPVYKSIVSWAFQSTPHPVVWMVRSDGILLSMTYERGTPGKEGVTAWAQHLTGTGPLLVSTGALAPFYEWDHFEQVCSVLEPVGSSDTGGYDEAVYFSVLRQSYDGLGVIRCIEKLSRFHPASGLRGAVEEEFSDARFADRLDSAIRFDGRYYYMGYAGPGYTLFAVTGGSAYADGEIVTLNVTGYSDVHSYLAFRNLPDHDVVFAAGDAGTTEIVFDPDGTNGIGPLHMPVVGFVSPTQLQVQIEGNLTAAQIAFVTSPNSWWALGTKTFTLAHLAHFSPDPGTFDGVRGVSAVLDGGTAGAVGSLSEPGTHWFDSAAGKFHAADPVVDASIGLTFNCDLMTLDAADPRGEIRNRFKATKRVGFEVSSARGLWVGQDFTDMVEWKQRKVVDGFGVMPLTTGYFEELIKGSWNKEGRVALRQWEPLPVQLMGLLREMELGGT